MTAFRIAQIREILNESQAAIISNDHNRFYFTGMTSSAGTVVITKGGAYAFYDFRYIEKAKQTVKNCKVILAEKLYLQIKEMLKSEGVSEIFIETDTVTLDSFTRLKTAFEGFVISENNVLSQKILELRSVKSSFETESIKSAQAITDKAFSYILEFIKEGVSEKEIMLELEYFMRKEGSEGVAFDTIVVSGKNSSLPHGVPSNKKLEKGDFVTMDFGAVVGGYCSDMTRTVAVGFVNDEQYEVYETVLKAQEEALKAIKAGAICKDIDKIARDIINKKYNGAFGHGLGHSVGLEIHENPAFNMRDETVLKSGTVMTVEPGIYLENCFGVRIEDMGIVTESGFENITKSTKELIIL